MATPRDCRWCSMTPTAATRKADHVGAAVAHDQRAAGEVDQQEAGDGGAYEQGECRQVGVAGLQDDHAERGQH